MQAHRGDVARLVAALAGAAATVLLYVGVLHVENAAIVSTTFMMIVLVLAATSRLWVPVLFSVVATLAFNFFFLPPVGTFTIVDPQNWAALLAFVAVSLVASHLSASVRASQREAVQRRDELARLFDVSRDVLMMTESRDAIPALSRSIARRFQLPFVAVAVPHATAWDVYAAGDDVVLDEKELWTAYAAAQRSIEFDAASRTYAGHSRITSATRHIDLVPLRSGTTPIGLMASSGRSIEPGTLDALAGVVAMAVERASLLEEKSAADLMRQSEQLKAALLASLGHDLRTPLTAIQVAAANLKDPGLRDMQRAEQAELILTESRRLNRLFENILEMARIEAGAVQTSARWTHPSEIFEGARLQVEETLRSHRLEVTYDGDVPVNVDPRLAATAVAHILENAAQYAPPDTPIEVTLTVANEALSIRIRDHGPGIPAGDLPHLFERFYRGASARHHSAGSGMGLWIARGLLAVVGGRIWAENCVDGGAAFTLVIPVPALGHEAPVVAYDEASPNPAR